MNRSLRIGTRRSALALAQAELVRAALAASGTPSEIVPMSTSGDEGTAPTPGAGGLKGLWIDSILEALEAEEIDLAVHSAKDLPAEDEEDLPIVAIPERGDPRDVLVTREAVLPHAATIGTSSVRRRSQLLAAFPGIHVVDLRGNVDTRLRKLGDGEVDAAVLAAAGLARLGVEPEHARLLPVDAMVPAPAQGALAIQAREDDEEARTALEPLDHPPTRTAVDAERSLMWRLGGNCAIPLGALATVDGDSVAISAVVAMPDGSRAVRAHTVRGSAEDAAAEATKQLIAGGAEEILDAVDSDGDEEVEEA